MEMGMEGSMINLGQDSVPIDLTGQVHILPCCIKTDGPCSVSHYFKPKPTEIEVEGLNVEEAYFRGRKLQGAAMPLPEGYTGFVLEKKNVGKRKASDGSDGSSSNCWKVKAKLEKITYWNHDSLPSQNDGFLRIFHWLTVAQSLHKPVTTEDLKSITPEKLS